MNCPRALFWCQLCIAGAVLAHFLSSSVYLLLCALAAVALAQHAKGGDRFVGSGPERIEFSEKLRQRLR